MATELVRRIRGTRTELGKKVRGEWIKAQDSYCEPLTFGDLSAGDKFISMPIPGDNAGHDGFLGCSWLFKKIEPTGDASEPLAVPYYNAVRLVDSNLSHMFDNMWVYKVQ